MKPTVWDWLILALSLTAWTIGIVGIAMLLNFPGDCALEVTNCGEGRRQASFVVLGLGFVWLGYLVVRFLRNPKKF